jgi:hypothetical protein
MVYKIKSIGRPRQNVKFRTIRNFKALKGFKFHKIKENKVYFKKE